MIFRHSDTEIQKNLQITLKIINSFDKIDILRTLCCKSTNLAINHWIGIMFYTEFMCLGELISRLNSKVSWILSYVENFFNIICDFLLMGALFMHILHGEKIEQPIEKLSESFLDRSLNWAAVGELKNGGLYLMYTIITMIKGGVGASQINLYRNFYPGD